MNIKFVADENIPFQVVEALRETGYEVATISEAHALSKSLLSVRNYKYGPWIRVYMVRSSGSRGLRLGFS